MEKVYTFKDAANAYRTKLMAEGRLSADTSRRVVLFETHFGKRPLYEITSQVAQKFINDKFALHAPATVNRNISILSAIFRVALQDGLMLHRVFLRLRRVGIDGTRTSHLELGEVMPVVEAVQSIAGPLCGFIILLLIDTGMRFGEAMRLEWGDLQPDWITVRPHKGKTRERKIPTSPRLIDYMKRYKILPEVGAEPTQRIILSRWSGGSPTGIGREMNRLLRAACQMVGTRDKDNMRLHDLRHTFAFLCASSGADLGDIKEMLGHTNISMTMRYRGFVATRAAEVVRKAMRVTTIGEDNAAVRAQ